jgi:hypothetical protein
MRPVKLLITATTVVAVILVAFLVVPRQAWGSYDRDLSMRGGDDDIVAFSRDVHVSRAVPGDVVVLNGSVTIDQPVDGDVVVLGGAVTFGMAGVVAGDLVCIGGNVTGAERRVRGELYAPGSFNDAMANALPGANRKRLLVILAVALKLTLLLLWMFATILVTLLAGKEVRQASIEVRASPLHTFAVGLVAYTSFILTAILFSTLVPFLIGVPLLVLLAVFAVVAKIFGTIAVFHCLGTVLAGARSRDQLASRRFLRGDLAMAIVGLILLGAIRMIPLVGTIIWGVVSLFGMGTTLATAFGRREPWFLAARAVES